jgi:hypothetical protein
MAEKLKPCQCCAGAATFDHDDQGWNWIECQACGLATNHAVHLMDDCKPALAERWNRRATEAEATGKQGAGDHSEPTRNMDSGPTQAGAPVPSVVARKFVKAEARFQGSPWQELSGTVEMNEVRGKPGWKVRFLYDGPDFQAPPTPATPSATVDVAASGEAVASVPKGYALVPICITPEMIDSAMTAHYGRRRVKQFGGASGVSMTVNNTDWTGVDAMRRFWKGALAAAPTPTAQDDVARDAERLDWVLERQAWVHWATRDGSIRQCQVYEQDEDEEYHILSGEDRYFNTERDAIDAAIAASKEKP